MKARAASSKSGLFLIELIIAILFFSVASAICVQLFAQAHLKSIQSKEISMAVTQAQSAAACIKAAENPDQQLSDLLQMQPEGNTLMVGYDKNWQVTQQNPTYAMQVTITEENRMRNATVEVTKPNKKENKQIYALQVSTYLG